LKRSSDEVEVEVEVEVEDECEVEYGHFTVEKVSYI
jgi:hypothetical protein